MKSSVKYLTVILLILLVIQAAGQDKKKWEKRGFYYPKVILVQLRSPGQRLKYLEANGRRKEAEELKQDIAGANAAMINDFKDHFKFCPFYFFADTNIDLVKAQQFGGALLDADLKPADLTAINGAGGQYFIIYYGHPEREKLSRDGDDDASRTRYGEGLVVTDNHYNQLQKPFQFYYYSNRGYYHLKGSKYSYVSKKYNIEYYPLAADVGAGVKDFFDN